MRSISHPSSQRYLSSAIREDLKEKMVFLGGARQVGKTTLAKTIYPKGEYSYLNWDIDKDRTRILDKDFNCRGRIIFDELHKFKRWRNWLKGLYDEHSEQLEILVTGSARLDLYRYGGESLQGRYHYLRLHPLSVSELGINSFKDMEELLRLGGFPEPFYKSSERAARRWSLEYRERLVRDEVSKLEKIEDLATLELLAKKIPNMVGSPLSINNLREDLDKAFNTIKNWLFVLEKLYHLFSIPTFSGSLLRANKKEKKYYLFDWSLVEDLCLRFENMVAAHLLKWVHYQQDVEGFLYDLRFFRDRDRKEVDFVLLKSNKPIMLIECKWSESQISDGLRYLHLKYPTARAIQVVFNPVKEYRSRDNIEVVSGLKFLQELV